MSSNQLPAKGSNCSGCNSLLTAENMKETLKLPPNHPHKNRAQCDVCIIRARNGRAEKNALKSQCIALTKSQDRCSRYGVDEFGGLCKQHHEKKACITISQQLTPQSISQQTQKPTSQPIMQQSIPQQMQKPTSQSIPQQMQKPTSQQSIPQQNQKQIPQLIIQQPILQQSQTPIQQQSIQTSTQQQSIQTPTQQPIQQIIMQQTSSAKETDQLEILKLISQQIEKSSKLLSQQISSEKTKETDQLEILKLISQQIEASSKSFGQQISILISQKSLPPQKKIPQILKNLEVANDADTTLNTVSNKIVNLANDVVDTTINTVSNKIVNSMSHATAKVITNTYKNGHLRKYNSATERECAKKRRQRARAKQKSENITTIPESKTD